MNQIGCVVLSYEEAGDLGGLLPWKIVTPGDVSPDASDAAGLDPRRLYSSLKERVPALDGFVFLSTCNRVEVIYSLTDEGDHASFALEFGALMPPLRAGIRPSLLSGPAALRHLLRLAAGLESMVLGETEIRAQLKEAFESAPSLDRRLRTLFQHIFREAREIRAQIPLNRLPLSVATLATGKLAEALGARRNSSDRLDARVAVIGSGPMSQQAARYLAKMGCRLVLINRRVERVQELAHNLGADVLAFDDFVSDPARAGVLSGLITATSRPDAFITPALLQKVTRSVTTSGEPGPCVLVDIALPADIQPACAELPGVTLIHMEGMRAELHENRQKRQAAAREAERYIEDAVYRLSAELITGLSAPVMTRLQREVRETARHHLDQLLKERLHHLTARDRRLLYDWAIRANRALNRLHRRGLADILRQYYAGRETARPEPKN